MTSSTDPREQPVILDTTDD